MVRTASERYEMTLMMENSASDRNTTRLLPNTMPEFFTSRHSSMSFTAAYQPVQCHINPSCPVQQPNFEKTVIPRPVNYLMEYAFTFTFTSGNTWLSLYGALSMTALFGLATLTFEPLNMFMGYSCYSSCQFWAFQASRVKEHDRQTNGQMPVIIS